MLENKLEKIAKIILYLTPILALIFIEGLFFPFIITKTLYFRLLINLVGSLYLILLILNYKKYKPRLNFAMILVIIFTAVNFIAALFGFNFYKSFWSDFERMEGLIGLIYLTAYLFLLQVFFREKKDWLVFIRSVVVVSLLVSLYGLIQKFNLLPVFQGGVDRVASTIGNAAFLAGFLLLSIGVSIYYWLNEEDKKYKIFALIAAGFNSLVLLLTSTRGAILGLIAGLFTFLLLNAIFNQGKAKKFSTIIVFIIIAAGAGFYFTRSYFSNSNIEFVSRLATISLSDATIINRLEVWKMALKEFKLRPILGVGIENFDVIYNKYYTPRITEDWFDRTHNIYLDQLVSGGIFGLAAYLAVFGYLFYKLFKRRKDDFYFFAVFTGLLAAYGVHNFFVFDSLSVSFLYFFLIGFIGFKYYEDKSTGEEKDFRPDKTVIVLAVIFIALANVLLFYKLIYLPLKLNRSLYIGYYYTIADTARSYAGYKTALSDKFGLVESACQLAKMYDVIAQEPTADKDYIYKLYQLTRTKLELAAAAYPLDVRTRLYLGQLITNNINNSEDVKEAEIILKEAVKLSPGRSEANYLLFNLYQQLGDQPKALKVLENYIEQVPWFNEAKIVFAAALYKTNPKRADELFYDALGFNEVYGSGTTKKIVTYLLNQKKYKETIPYYQHLIITDYLYEYGIDLAKIYYLTGDIDKAVEEIEFVKAKSPQSLNGNEEFLNMLNSAYNNNK